MGGFPGNDQALVTELRLQANTVNDLFLDHWKDDESRRRGLIGRLIFGTKPRSRYAKADELIVLRDALMELILAMESMVALAEPQRQQMQRINQEISSWRRPDDQIPASPKRKRRLFGRIRTGRTSGPKERKLDSEKKKPGLEELWQLACDVECLTIELADDRWLRRRLESEACLSPAERPLANDGTGRNAATISPGAEIGHRDLDDDRYRLLDASRDRARSARQRRANEALRAERLMTAGVLTFPVAILTAAFFSWAVSWPRGIESGPGYVFVRAALAVFAGALGGGLARLVRLRDAPLGALESDRFRSAFIVQMMLGGAFGVVALVLVQLGALPSVGNGGAVEMTALYAFLAGWSEPFILGVLNRLGSSEDHPPRRGKDPTG
jgi:hypothetical protein